MPCGVCCQRATCVHLSLGGFSQASKEGSACIVQDRLNVQRTNTSTQLSAGIRQQLVDGRGKLKLLASWVGQLHDPSPCFQRSQEDGVQLVTLVTCSLQGFFLSPYHSPGCLPYVLLVLSANTMECQPPERTHKATPKLQVRELGIHTAWVIKLTLLTEPGLKPRWDESSLMTHLRLGIWAAGSQQSPSESIHRSEPHQDYPFLPYPPPLEHKPAHSPPKGGKVTLSNWILNKPG